MSTLGDTINWTGKKLKEPQYHFEFQSNYKADSASPGRYDFQKFPAASVNLSFSLLSR